jgi:formamidopyrimidine-DNA glycosylase
MPELPEVETVRRGLEELVVGRTIAAVEVRLPRIVRTPSSPESFANQLVGLTVTGVGRRGKYLLFHIPPYTLVSHLRMEGKYRMVPASDALEPHTHVIFQFTHGEELRYRDVRQFGTMDLTRTDQEWPKGLRELGPEPLEDELTVDLLHQKLHRRSAPLKAVLLDQTTLAGLGKIYVDEALFKSRLHPELPANRITQNECERLLTEIRSVLQSAIDAGGSSIRSYVNGYGRHGGFQILLDVYGRSGEPCHVCGSTIQKLRVAGRGTHVCPVCQQKPKQPRKRTTEKLAKVRTGKGIPT